jgi:hypothetical protein
VVPDDKVLLERAAIAGLEAGDQAFVETLLPRLPETPDGVLIRAREHIFPRTADTCPRAVVLRDGVRLFSEQAR